MSLNTCFYLFNLLKSLTVFAQEKIFTQLFIKMKISVLLKFKFAERRLVHVTKCSTTYCLSMETSDLKTFGHGTRCSTIVGWGHGSLMYASLCCFSSLLFVSSVDIALKGIGLLSSSLVLCYPGRETHISMLCLKISVCPKFRVEALLAWTIHTSYKTSCWILESDRSFRIMM